MIHMEKVSAQYALLGDDLEVISNVILHIDKNNEIIDIEESSKEIRNGLLVMPGLFNAHVHAADIGLRGVKSNSLAELVGLNGIKHNFLREQSKSHLNKSIAKSYEEAIISGTLGWSDFREGGIEGLSTYPLRSKYFSAFGRPTLEDMDKLPYNINIGFRSIRSFSKDHMISISEIARKQGRKVFMHASESKKIREYSESHLGVSDIQWAISHMKVDALVHLTHIAKAEIPLMVKSNTGGILCIRSNKFTQSGEPPVRDLVNSSITLGIGTDNAMFFPLSLWDEIRELRKHNIDSERLLSMATVEGARLCGFDWGIKMGNSNLMALAIEDNIPQTKIKEWLVKNGNKVLIQASWI